VEATGTGFLLSFRHLDAVYRIRKSDGAVLWKVGGTNRPESLTVVGDPAGANTFGGQHDARQPAHGTVTVYDNGTGLGRPPRGVRFQINATTKTAQFLEQVKDASAPSSGCCGSNRRLPGGNWVLSWTTNPLVTESITGGGTAFRLTFGGGVFSYRAVPVVPGVLSGNALRAGMDTMNPRP
jgi:arylsulfotransferase ASST